MICLLLTDKHFSVFFKNHFVSHCCLIFCILSLVVVLGLLCCTEINRAGSPPHQEFTLEFIPQVYPTWPP